MKCAAGIFATIVIPVPPDFNTGPRSRALAVQVAMALPTAAFEGKQLLKKFMLRTAVRMTLSHAFSSAACSNERTIAGSASVSFSVQVNCTSWSHWSPVAQAVGRNAAPLGLDGRAHIRQQFEAHRLQPTAYCVSSAAVTFLTQERPRSRSH
jgi:hypothetical protein